MRVSDKAIVLQTIKLGDKKFLIKLYSKNHGLLPVICSVGKSPSSKIKPATIQSLNLVQVELVLKQNKEIHQLTEANCYEVFDKIPNSFSKLSIAQFLNEVLIKCLHEQSLNHYLYEFIETCLCFLNDEENDFNNLHLYFLVELTKYLGFEPQNNFSSNTPFFDCRAGSFTAISLVMPLGLTKEESVLFSEFLKINSLKTNISTQQRRVLIDILLAYYKLHIPGFNDLKSLDVLQTLHV